MKYTQLENLNNRIAVIVGGCGQVGYATATRLAQRGATVISLVRRYQEEAQSMMDMLPKDHGQQHLALLASITDTESIKRAVEEIKVKTGRCDILVNAAGIGKNIKADNFKELTDEIFDDILKTNLRGVFSVIREFQPLLTDESLIVNISSTAGLRASQSNPAYGAAKAGVDLLTKTLAKVLGPKTRVVAIAPGYLEKATSGINKLPGFNERVAETLPLRRVGQGEDIAATIESLATTMRYVTGQTIVVDGGMSL